MAIEITNLADLSETDVQANLATIVELLQEANPSLDMKRGVVHDLLAYYAAVLTTKNRTETARYLSARSLQQITADPTLAEDDIVDDVLSNWGITRNEGTQAAGEVTIVLTGNTSVTIGAGTVFTANGITYTCDAAYTAKPDAAGIGSDTDRLMSELEDGNWAFTVFVTADDAGSEAIIKKDTLIVPSVLPLNYLTSYATSDFSGGVNTETNEELVERLQQGIAAKVPCNRVNMMAMLRAQADYSGVVNQSIIGFGDSEMLRDRHGIFPVSCGGRVDWYVRTQQRVLQTTLTKTATLLSKDEDGGVWQVNFDTDEVQGLYEVSSILLPAATTDAVTFAITEEIRDVSLPTSGYAPDIDNAVEGVYTAYQTVMVRFLDDQTDHTDLAAGATQEYSVTVKHLPLIAEIQAYVNGHEVRSVLADVLVKAPVPCFTQVSCTIAKKNTQTDPDVDAIQQAVAAYINTVDFVGMLSASALHDVIHGYLSAGMTVTSTDLFGRIRKPDGSTVYVRNDELLQLVEDTANMTSSRTVQFFTDPGDVAITIEASVPVPA